MKIIEVAIRDLVIPTNERLNINQLDFYTAGKLVDFIIHFFALSEEEIKTEAKKVLNNLLSLGYDNVTINSDTHELRVFNNTLFVHAYGDFNNVYLFGDSNAIRTSL